MAKPPDRRQRLGPVTRGTIQDPHHHDQVESQDNPLAGLKPVPCQCWLRRWHRACDKAIDLNGAVRLEGAHSIMVVADTVVAEVAANGGEIPETYRLMREDGRVVYVFMDEDAA